MATDSERTMTLNAYMLDFLDPQFLAYLHRRLDARVNLTFGDTPSIPPDTHLLIAARPTPEQLSASPLLHSLIIPFAGLPEVTRQRLHDFPHIRVYNLHHNSASAAEMAITLMLSAAKYIVPADRTFRTHDWSPRHAPMPSQILEGKTVLILGYGAIGKRVAVVCRALGMRVSAIKRRVEESSYPDEVYSLDHLHALLSQANVVVVCLPLTPVTKGLIGAKEIALLPDGAIIVNVGRAPIVDEQALYEALYSGKLHAAGFDVWYRYPENEEEQKHTPPSHYPFHELDNIVMSPHRAGGVFTEAIEYARMNGLAAALNAAARGEPIPNPVDLEAGY